jgi:ABC-type glycerol-3-phosphate transport system substrate-binding protein
MKRTLAALLLALTALLGTAACGDNSGSGESNPPDTETQVPAPVPS